MKRVKITMILDVSDDHFDEMQEVKNDILSGKLQREMLRDEKCLNCKATFEELK